jgi:hypothetical protein
MKVKKISANNLNFDGKECGGRFLTLRTTEDARYSEFARLVILDCH